jgi:hypothetical protein
MIVEQSVARADDRLPIPLRIPRDSQSRRNVIVVLGIPSITPSAFSAAAFTAVAGANSGVISTSYRNP